MPTIFDNIENYLDKGLLKSLESSFRADFCVGYFYLRGWKILQDKIDLFDGGDNCCRLLVGMQRPAEELVKEMLQLIDMGPMDNPRALAIKKEVARSFREQLTLGIPTTEDEKCLQKLKDQLKEGKVVVKLFLKHTLHAKLYLLHRNQEEPLKGYVGSSNLTMSGLSKQGELNVDVVDQDSAKKLSKWFNDRWDDRWSIDISKELIEIIEESWASEKMLPPYYIYLKIAYHLSQEARSGINNYMIPQNLKDDLMLFQENAVSVAARHLDKRGGVLISDVVGLGKTLTATAVAKLMEETFYTETLIICPKNLTEMWEDYVHRYQLHAKVVSISTIKKDFLTETRRFRVVIIDESHNLRNRQGKTYAVVKEYLQQNESKVILLTATPYNKTYNDISSQLRLFIPEDKDIAIMPDRFIEAVGGLTEFRARYPYSPSTILAFEKSGYSEDWQELLKMYMVRRTRSFIKNNYATWDEEKKRHFIEFKDGKKNYFPIRIPKRITFSFDEGDKTDVYVKLYSDGVVTKINSLTLSRYGLGNYINELKTTNASAQELQIIENLGRAGKRLMGFCRTNLFKRLESCGLSFLTSLARHALKNQVFIYAIEHGLSFPIGPQESADMDEFLEESDDSTIIKLLTKPDEYKAKAKDHFAQFVLDAKRYDWIPAAYFNDDLKTALENDVAVILSIIEIGKEWNPDHDKKLLALHNLCFKTHKTEKILVFTQFADTANYLIDQLQKTNSQQSAVVTGAVENPTAVAHSFSPKSNKKEVKHELRILIATDVLSEGQNLQDGHIIVNYDLPWAIIRLIQRAGRVDRIGQEHDEIVCYSFLPQDGIERIIQLRNRLTTRITENSEVVGSDETFFDGDPINIKDLYNEKSGILDSEDDGDVDLTSQAYEIWNQATKANPELKKKIPALADVVHSTKSIEGNMIEGAGVITYHRNSHNYEVLTWLAENGQVVSQSQSRILKSAECALDTPAMPRIERHFDLVKQSVELAEKDAANTGGQLGPKTGARYKSYMILKRYHESVKNTLFDVDGLKKTIDDIYKFPLRETAREMINRRLKLNVSDEELAELAMRLRDENRFCIIDPSRATSLAIPQIICSLGISTVNT